MRRALTTAILLAALLAPCTSVAYARRCAGANLIPDAHDLKKVKAAVLCLINRERVRHGERPLRGRRRLARAAKAHSHDMVTHSYFSHDSPSGQTPLDRIRSSGFISRETSWSIGENIAWGTGSLATPREIVSAWMQSPGHRANILDPNFRFTGIGISARLPRSLSSGQRGAMYTQDFAAVTRG